MIHFGNRCASVAVDALDTEALERAGASLQSKILPGLILPTRAIFHLETAAKLLKLLERALAVFSKCPLKLLDNQADFDSAIPRFESWRPSQISVRSCSRSSAKVRYSIENSA